MTAEEARVFGENVLNIVAQIPHGQVTTYGNIAALAGWPSHSRMEKHRDGFLFHEIKCDEGLPR
nr:MGMT family protein [Prevotella sp. MA2016]